MCDDAPSGLCFVGQVSASGGDSLAVGRGPSPHAAASLPSLPPPRPLLSHPASPPPKAAGGTFFGTLFGFTSKIVASGVLPRAWAGLPGIVFGACLGSTASGVPDGQPTARMLAGSFAGATVGGAFGCSTFARWLEDDAVGLYCAACSSAVCAALGLRYVLSGSSYDKLYEALLDYEGQNPSAGDRPPDRETKSRV